VADYVGLGSRPLLATADDTGLNPGNWTNHYTGKVIAVNVPQFEVYHMVVTQAMPGTQAVIYAGPDQYSFVMPVGGSEWDPSQPLLLNPSQELVFAWNTPATGTPPKTTLWLRYDAARWSNP